MISADGNGWASRKLDELGFVSRGRSRHRPRNAPELYGGPYPFFQTGDIKAANLHLTKSEQTYSEAGLAQSKLWSPGTLCITIAANIAETAILGIPGCFPDSVVGFVAHPSKADVRFVKYYIDTIKLSMQNVSRGTTQDNLSVEKLLSFEFLAPPVEHQRKIASILSSYDDLIENSTRRIAILEEMAQAIYREWFVEFRFPGHENIKLVDSPLGKIPEGWNVVRLDALKAAQQHAINGGPFGSKLGTKDYVSDGVPVIRGTNLSEAGRFCPEGFVFVSEEKADTLRPNLARPGDIVVTQRGTLGQVGVIPGNTPFERFVISQSQMKITLDDEKANRDYVFQVLKADEAQTRIRNLAVSSGVPHINLGTLRDFEIVLPPRSLQEQFADFASSAEASIALEMSRIRNLRKTRDLLLPKLISGQLDVENLDIDTGPETASELAEAGA